MGGGRERRKERGREGGREVGRQLVDEGVKGVRVREVMKGGRKEQRTGGRN